MIADLDTLLTALYVELTTGSSRFASPAAAGREGRRKSPTPSSPAWPWRRSCSGATTSGTGCAPPRAWSGTCSRGCWPRASTTRLRQIAPLMEAALRWLADATPAPRSCCG